MQSNKLFRNLKDSQNAYGYVSIGAHWLCAVLIIGLFILGVYMRTLEYDSPWYYRAPEIHIAVGLVLFLLMLLRFSWRLKSRTPDPIQGQKASAVFLAKLIKWALYLLVFQVCLTGYFITTAEGKGAYFFNFFSIPSLAKLSPDQSELVAKVHKLSAWSIVILVGLHAGAALVHHFIFRDETLKRMLRTKE